MFPRPGVASPSTVFAKEAAKRPPAPVLRGQPEKDDCAWRPNMLIHRPPDHWRGLTEYVPWKPGNDIGASPPLARSEKNRQCCIGLETLPSSPLSLSLSLSSPSLSSRLAAEGGDAGGEANNRRGCRVDDPSKENVKNGVVSGGDCCFNEEKRVSKTHADRTTVAVGNRMVYITSGLAGERGRSSDKTANSIALSEVETALHGVLDTLRRVREARLGAYFTRIGEHRQHVQ